jgi:tetratricopeptide (TPR) repeat protein
MTRRVPLLLAATATAVLLLSRLGGGGDPQGLAAAPAAPVAASVTDLEPALPAGTRSTDEIVELWSTRVDSHPADYLSRVHLANALMVKARDTGDLELYEQAEAVARQALNLNPRYPSALLALSAARSAQHDFRSARDLADRVHEADANHSGALAAVADADLELGNYAAAADGYRRLAMRERSAPVVARLARLAFIEGRPREAVALSAEAVELARQAGLRGRSASFYSFQLAHHLHDSGEIDAAAAVLEDLLAGDPRHLGSRELLAKVRVSQGRLDVAAAVYEALLEQTPAADLHGALSAVLRALGDEERARRHEALALEVAAQTAGRFPAERRHLAGLYARLDPSRAVTLAREDLETRHDVYAWDTLAWALYNTGDHEAAAAAADRALALGTRSAELLYHAGLIRAATGDDVEARSLLTTALEINPRFDVVEAPRATAVLAALDGV